MTEQIVSTKQLIPDGILGYAKAVVAFLVSLGGALLTVLPADGTLDQLSTAQWIGIAVTVLGTTGAVFGVPNAVKPTPPAPVLPADEPVVDDTPGRHAADQ